MTVTAAKDALGRKQYTVIAKNHNEAEKIAMEMSDNKDYTGRLQLDGVEVTYINEVL